jgi:hypothetical protein
VGKRIAAERKAGHSLAAIAAKLNEEQQEVLEHLASIRAAIAAEVGSQESLQGLSAALRALFEGFTLHSVELGSERLPAAIVGGELTPPGYLIEPHVRVEAVAGRAVLHLSDVSPRLPDVEITDLHRVPLALGRNKEPLSQRSW